jgi:hypothetical protein
MSHLGYPWPPVRMSLVGFRSLDNDGLTWLTLATSDTNRARRVVGKPQLQVSAARDIPTGSPPDSAGTRRRRSTTAGDWALLATTRRSCGPGWTPNPIDFGSGMDHFKAKVCGKLPDQTWSCPGHGNDSILGNERPPRGGGYSFLAALYEIPRPHTELRPRRWRCLESHAPGHCRRWPRTPCSDAWVGARTRLGRSSGGRQSHVA